MRVRLTRTLLLACSALLYFSTVSAANQPIEIEEAGIWPDSPGHNEEPYVDARITPTVEVDRAWFVGFSRGKIVAERDLVDSNGDGYFVSPAAFEVTGGRLYRVNVHACATDGRYISEKLRFRSRCSIGLFDRCLL